MQIHTVGEIRQTIKGLPDDYKVLSYDSQGYCIPISMYIHDPQKEKDFEKWSKEEKERYPALVIDISK